MFERNSFDVWPVQKMFKSLRGPQYFSTRNTSVHLHQHLQHGHRVPRPAGNLDQGGGGQQPRLQLHLHRRDAPQAHCLRLCAVCQWWLQCLWRLHSVLRVGLSTVYLYTVFLFSVQRIFYLEQWNYTMASCTGLPRKDQDCLCWEHSGCWEFWSWSGFYQIFGGNW